MRSEKQVPKTLKGCICKAGAPIGLTSDNAKSELRGKMKDLLHMCKIDDRQSEPHCQHQNPVERKMQDAKRTMNLVMDRTGCPKKWWPVCVPFVIALFNHLPDLHGDIPLMEVTAHIQGISKFMHFHCWQEACIKAPKGGKENTCWAMPAPDTGDESACLVILDGAENMAPPSNVRAAKDPLCPDMWLGPQTDDPHSPLDTKPSP